MRIAVIAVTSKNGEKGGAERFYEGLVLSLNSSGIKADIINIISDEDSFEKIEETLLRFYDLDLSGYDGVISTKAPSYLIRHPNHICYLIHTMRVFYDMFELEFRTINQTVKNQRDLIHKIDRGALSKPKTKKIFTIGREVSRRLLKWNKLESEVLHPALPFDNFETGSYDYIFMPGRLHRWKRVDLIINAFKYIKAPLILKIAGVGEDQNKLKALAADDKRIQFLGKVSDKELINYYSNALAVPFVPKNEDYGYVTLEAFKSEKPVITCNDSGEPAYFVCDGDTGFVCNPDPREIAQKIEFLHKNRDAAKEMGKRAKRSIDHIRWDSITEKLVNTLTSN